MATRRFEIGAACCALLGLAGCAAEAQQGISRAGEASAEAGVTAAAGLAQGGSSGVGGPSSGGGNSQSAGGTPLVEPSPRGGQAAVAGAPACPGMPPMRGLQVRLMASDGVDLEGESVASWRDVSGTGNAAATQGDGQRRPSVERDAINGSPVVHFDGEDDYLRLPFEVSGRQQMTIASVSRTWGLQNGSPNRDCDFNGDGLTDVGRELNCSGTDQSLITWPEQGGQFSATGIFYGLGQTEATFRFGTGEEYRHYKTPFVLTEPPGASFVWAAAVMAGAERRFFLNGKTPSGRLDYRDDIVESLQTSARQTYGGSSRPDWPVAVEGTEGVANIGRGRFEPSSSFWAGDLAELLIYDTALDEAELAALGAYLACSYGLD